MTERLYLCDSWLGAFAARVVGHGRWPDGEGGRRSVILDRTGFYPEAGGQMADRGRLESLPVVDVQVDEGGVIHHLVDGDPPAIGAEVHGAIDWPRRRVHMALHTGQHMLSRALLDVAGAETVSSRLGETGCTVDVALERVPEAQVVAAVALVTSVIDADLEVRAFVPEPGELAALPLRRAPKVARDIRVVEIGDFDVSPCGGTHCTRTGQVALVHVRKLERYKGMTRIWFDAGGRARHELASHSVLLTELGRELTSGPAEVPAAVARLRRELADALASIRALHLARAEAVAHELVAAARAEGRTRVVAVLDGGAEVLRAVAAAITAHPDLVALLASPG
ncbi:MAG TPA: alanyl-tRNA editing protein, partial [Kofleriaceae bacterium]|nr:alanyl-tRNA editing protein [Kofleriaceae bacterium]